MITGMKLCKTLLLTLLAGLAVLTGMTASPAAAFFARDFTKDTLTTAPEQNKDNSSDELIDDKRAGQFSDSTTGQLSDSIAGQFRDSKDETFDESRAGQFVRHITADLLTGTGGSTLRLSLSLGYQYTDRFSAGIGTGYAFYFDPVDLVPVYLDLMYLLGHGSNTAFLQLKTGHSYSVVLSNEINSERHRGGFFFQPAVGVRIGGLSLTAGFSLDHASWEQVGFFGQVIREKISFRRAQMGIGFHF